MIFCLLTFRSLAAFLLARSSSRLLAPVPVPSHCPFLSLLSAADLPLAGALLPDALFLPPAGTLPAAAFFLAAGFGPAPVLLPDAALSVEADLLPAAPVLPAGLPPFAALPSGDVLLPPDPGLPLFTALPSGNVLLPAAVLLLPPEGFLFTAVLPSAADAPDFLPVI